MHGTVLFFPISTVSGLCFVGCLCWLSVGCGLLRGISTVSELCFMGCLCRLSVGCGLLSRGISTVSGLCFMGCLCRLSVGCGLLSWGSWTCHWISFLLAPYTHLPISLFTRSLFAVPPILLFTPLPHPTTFAPLPLCPFPLSNYLLLSTPRSLTNLLHIAIYPTSDP